MRNAFSLSLSLSFSLFAEHADENRESREKEKIATRKSASRRAETAGIVCPRIARGAFRN